MWYFERTKKYDIEKEWIKEEKRKKNGNKNMLEVGRMTESQLTREGSSKRITQAAIKELAINLEIW